MLKLKFKTSFLYLIVFTTLISGSSCKKEPEECPWCPQVNSITPASAPYGDTVFIKGKYLLPNPNFNDVLQVKFNGVTVPEEYILENYDDSIRLIIPKGTLSGPVTVELNESDGLIGTESANFEYIYTPAVSTFAGNGTNALVDNADLLNASFSNVDDMTIDPVTGVLYVHDLNKIRTASKLNGVRTLQTSTNPAGQMLACDNNGKIFFYQTANYTMRKLDFNTIWNYNHYAGKSNVSGHLDSTLDESTFNLVLNMKFDYQNNLIFGDDQFLRKINTTDSVITRIAGTVYGYQDGPVATAMFSNVWAVEPLDDGSVYIADYDNHVIRKVKSGQVATIAGIAGQPGSANAPIGINAQMQLPLSIAFDGNNKLYFIDDATWIRVIDLTTTAVTVAAGDSTNNNNFGYVDGPPFDARFSYPNKIVFDKQRNILYINDAGNHVIRQITFE
ncbi:MAG TPA: IPT/TIG domain-containing protein [Bacteroidia bacterium]|nr:IPT/TIG domain-containing protein [Bacteroidia bacterium]